MRSVELFTGCGGLALGLSRAGFRHEALIERDGNSVRNITHNKVCGLQHVAHWPILREDVRYVDWRPLARVDVVAGGPPCQPFSIGGKHRGHEDKRDMWPEAVRAVREIGPRAFLFENVRGLARPAFADYLRWIELSLAAPQIRIDENESRDAHLRRLEHRRREALYDIRILKVNAADYGAPQKRHRIVFLGVRKDLDIEIETPIPTHSHERLLWDQWITGRYWERHGLSRPSEEPAGANDARVARRLRQHMIPPTGKPWITCRDAFSGLGEPGSRDDLANHIFQPGARSYAGHTGSPLDEPAKALKAGDHGVPGGENMIAFADGSVRYFTVREAARLQGLPDDYEFIGSWTENMRQLGNAVPSMLAEVIARRLAGLLSRERTDKRKAAA
ncbi:DNA (cytosine-5-)-methyltransferase [Inquilinus sp. CAU 1745]|uniref:DNA cytosine methyltransferase n=1 Tax=Inquilinus sp. CAU 1745 TaxID=3140369 RepID=UPI00325C0265